MIIRNNVSEDTSQNNTEYSVSDSQEPEVYIVDDMEQVQDVVHLILESEGIKAKKFNSGEEFLAQKEISEIGCLLLDNQMPGMSGLDVQAALLSRDINIPIIFISGDSRYNEVAEAVRDGAFYFLQKPFARSDLLERVREAIDASRNITTKLLQSKKNRELLGSLTGRESQVYQLVTDGLTNKAISESLDISNGTVEFHRANMMKKLHAKSLADLMEINRSLKVK